MIAFYEHEDRNTTRDGWHVVISNKDEDEGRFVSEEKTWKRRFHNHDDLNDVGIRPDRLSSMKIGPGCTVHIYEHHEFDGRDKVYPAETGKATNTIENVDKHDGLLNEISSMEIECDSRVACQNPALLALNDAGGDLKRCITHCSFDATDPQLNCADGTDKSENCGKCQNAVQQYCSQNLAKEDCRKFCSNPYNKCDENMIVNYCNANLADPYCKCLQKIPGDPADTSTTASDKDLEVELAKHAGNNAACWNVKGANACRQGTVPMPGQLQRPSWWQGGFASQCPSFCQAVVDFRNNNLNMADTSSINLLSDMNCGNTTPPSSGGSTTNPNPNPNQGSASATPPPAPGADDSFFGELIPGIQNVYLLCSSLCCSMALIVILALALS